MTKRDHESFKEYAQRWRELVAQVQPPQVEKEMVTMFIDTLSSPFYDKVVENVSSNFSNLLVVGERIETGIKRGKFAHAGSSIGFARKSNLEKKKGVANAIGSKLALGYGRATQAPPLFPTQIQLHPHRAPVAWHIHHHLYQNHTYRPIDKVDLFCKPKPRMSRPYQECFGLEEAVPAKLAFLPKPTS
ncbi:hypothetical protein CR513_40440, partial [Mucuna pruriens]